MRKSPRAFLQGMSGEKECITENKIFHFPGVLNGENHSSTNIFIHSVEKIKYYVKNVLNNL